jgi:molybdate transport system substrate-binding protein
MASALAVAAMLAPGCGGTTDGESGGARDQVVVMAASSLTDVVVAVSATDPNVTVILSGSSTLVAQLSAGADADVLITADAATMDRATADGSIRGLPVVIATNTVVLATAPGNPGGVAGLADLARRDLLVGLCAPEVPCGALSRRALDEARIIPSVDTLELNVRALTAKLSLGELDAGLVYGTDAAVAGLSTVNAPELDGHANRYFIASVSADPAPRVQAVIDDFTEPGAVGTETLLAHGFGPP